MSGNPVTMSYAPPATGDVVGPAGATDDLPAVFDGTTGKTLKQKTYAAFKTLLALVKADVGLGSVDNTSDANKPVSTAQATADGLRNLKTANLSDVANAATAFSNIKQAASTTATGVSELATSAEVLTGTDTARVVTPSGLAASGYAWAFPSGTRMLFQQNLAPTGWTKETSATYNDNALRVYSSGTFAATGGTVAFSTAFGLTATNAHTLSAAEMPSHDHDIDTSTSSGSSGSRVAQGTGTSAGLKGIPIYNTGGGGSHSHNIDLRVKFTGVTIATKD